MERPWQLAAARSQRKGALVEERVAAVPQPAVGLVASLGVVASTSQKQQVAMDVHEEASICPWPPMLMQLLMAVKPPAACPMQLVGLPWGAVSSCFLPPRRLEE